MFAIRETRSAKAVSAIATAALFISMFASLVPATALASVSITSATFNGGAQATVSSGGNVTIAITVNRSGSNEENDWESTRVTFQNGPGPDITQCYDTTDFTTGTGNSNASLTAVAPTSAGTHDASITAYRQANCSSGDDNDVFTDAVTVTASDTTAPVLAEVTPVPTPDTDTTPNYTFSSTEAGTITYGGACSSATTAAVVGNNTITFNTLATGTHTNCTIQVQDASNNTSATLSVSSFTINPVLTPEQQCEANGDVWVEGVCVDADEYACEEAGGTWNDGSCDMPPPPSCVPGQVGTYPDCVTLPSVPGATQCSDLIDNDEDGAADWFSILNFFGFGDSDCESLFDDSEGPSVPPPTDVCTNEETDPGTQTEGPCNADDVCPNDAGIQTSSEDCTPEDNGGGDEDGEEGEGDNGGSDNGGSSSSSSGGGGGGGGGTVYCTAERTAFCSPASGGAGLVLGASTDMCSEPLLSSYIGLGKDNKLEDVVKLQLFLNQHLNAGLEVDGVFDLETAAAVEQFQLKYASDILAPWVPFGLASAETPTGYVYKTTQWMINKLSCAGMTAPAPQLP